MLAPQIMFNVVVNSFSGKLKDMTVSLTASASIKKVSGIICSEFTQHFSFNCILLAQLGTSLQLACVAGVHF